jgi:hypothetical protein
MCKVPSLGYVREELPSSLLQSLVVMLSTIGPIETCSSVQTFSFLLDINPVRAHLVSLLFPIFSVLFHNFFIYGIRISHIIPLFLLQSERTYSTDSEPSK